MRYPSNTNESTKGIVLHRMILETYNYIQNIYTLKSREYAGQLSVANAFTVNLGLGV
jgi:hypothetical protein